MPYPTLLSHPQDPHQNSPQMPAPDLPTTKRLPFVCVPHRLQQESLDISFTSSSLKGTVYCLGA